MTTKKALLSYSLGFLLLSSQSLAQSMNLDEALSKVNQSPAVMKSEAAAEEASWGRVGSYAGFLPSITASGSRLFDKKYVFTDINFGGNPVSVPGIVPTTAYGIGFQWLLFDGFANIDQWQAARAFERAGKNDFDWTRFQTERQVVVLFYKALAAQTLKEVAEQNLKTLNDHLGDVKLFKSAGVSTNYDVLQVEVRVSEAQSEIMNATDNVETSRQRLYDALGVEDDRRPLAGEIPIMQGDLLNNQSSVIHDRKDLNALTDKVRGYSELRDASSKHWIPKISLYGNVQNYNNIDDSWNRNFRDAYNLGVQFTWSIFSGFADMAKDKQNIEKRTQAEQNLRQAQLNAKTDVDFWRRKYAYYCTVYRARQADIGRSTESLRLAREGRKAGIRTSTDMLDAESDLFRSRATSVTAQVGAVEALVNFELATGQKVYDFK